MAYVNNVVNKAVIRSRRASSMRVGETGEIMNFLQNPKGGNPSGKTPETKSESHENACEPEMEASAEPNVTVFVTVGNGPHKATGVIKGYPDASR